ncbi:hypothetical protein V8C26DRAFT_353906 [Trichoderma gracile]
MLIAIVGAGLLPVSTTSTSYMYPLLHIQVVLAGHPELKVSLGVYIKVVSAWTMSGVLPSLPCFKLMRVLCRAFDTAIVHRFCIRANNGERPLLTR